MQINKIIKFIQEHYQTNDFIPLHKPTFGEHEKALVGDTIDSTFVSSVGKYVNKFGSPTIALMNYNPAGPYPSCFDNLTKEQKLTESNKILERNINNLVECAKILSPEWVMPFAGEFIICGREDEKNDYTGVMSKKELESKISEHFKVLLLNSGETFNTNDAQLPHYQYTSKKEIKSFIKNNKNFKYSYESDVAIDIDALKIDLVN